MKNTPNESRMNYTVDAHKKFLEFVKTRILNGNIKHDARPFFDYYIGVGYKESTAKYAVGTICNEIGMQVKKKPHGYVSANKQVILSNIDTLLGIAPKRENDVVLPKTMSDITMAQMKKMCEDEVTKTNDELHAINVRREKMNSDFEIEIEIALAKKNKAIDKLNNFNSMMS